MPTLEELTYDTARDALKEQEADVAGIRQRTGTLLAAHALVASFLGSPVLRERGLVPLAWVGLASLVGGLMLAGALLAPWRMRFTLNAVRLYASLRDTAETDASSVWLLRAAHLSLRLYERNERRLGWLSRASVALTALMVVQVLAWVLALA